MICLSAYHALWTIVDGVWLKAMYFSSENLMISGTLFYLSKLVIGRRDRLSLRLVSGYFMAKFLYALSLYTPDVNVYLGRVNSEFWAFVFGIAILIIVTVIKFINHE